MQLGKGEGVSLHSIIDLPACFLLASPSICQECKGIVNRYLKSTHLLSLIFLVSCWVVLAHPALAVKEASKTLKAAVSFSCFPPMYTPVRVGVATRAGLARVAVWAPGALFVEQRPVFHLNSQSVYSISGGKITELATGNSYPLPVGQRCILSASDYRIWANNRWYRGCIELIVFPHAVTVINLLDLEDYLPGVVPSEMPSTWCFEALKAQAIAARSYAWAHLGPGSKWMKSEGFDLVPDVRDQMYRGLAAEARSSTLAVYSTRGMVLKDADRVKPGFYRAWVGDVYENLNIRKSIVPSSTLEKMTGIKDIVGMTVKRWDPATGNAYSIQVMGANKKTKEVYGVKLAQMLHFSTAGILDVHEEGNNWIFTYRGPGNGSRGLSQHGANMLAQKGWRFDQILQQYYQDPDGRVRLGYTADVERALRYKYAYEHNVVKPVEGASENQPAQAEN
jgi:peptidoglycan hydrolase-like amidase